MPISMGESLKLCFFDFLSHKLRNIVTIFSIILGTMSIIVILAIVNGIQQETLRWMLEQGGTLKVTVWRNWEYQGDDTLPGWFTLNEFNYIKAVLPPVDAYSTTLRNWGTSFSYGQKQAFASVAGTLPDYQKTNEWTVQEGRFITHLDYIYSHEVIVLGTSLKEMLFGNKNAIGEYITCNERRYMVVGIMTHREMKDSMSNMWMENPLEYMNRMSFIPLSTMMTKTGGNYGRIENLDIRAVNEAQVRVLVPILKDILLNMRKGQEVFWVRSSLLDSEESNNATVLFKIIFIFISSISLLVGGIVVMNIMLATIKERTREIGIRIAIGARQWDIFFQFLVQTIIITFSGGVIGAIFAISSMRYIAKFMKLNPLLEPSMVLMALGVSILVGLFFGIYPAVLASKLDPVKALRNE